MSYAAMHPVWIRVKINSTVLLVVAIEATKLVGIKITENRGPVWPQVWHDKDPSLLRSRSSDDVRTFNSLDKYSVLYPWRAYQAKQFESCLLHVSESHRGPNGDFLRQVCKSQTTPPLIFEAFKVTNNPTYPIKSNSSRGGWEGFLRYGVG